MDTGVNSTATHSAASYNKDGIQGKDVHHTTSLDGEPAFPTTPVLSLELENISKLSKGGREGLSYMWSGEYIASLAHLLLSRIQVAALMHASDSLLEMQRKH